MQELKKRFGAQLIRNAENSKADEQQFLSQLFGRGNPFVSLRESKTSSPFAAFVSIRKGGSARRRWIAAGNRSRALATSSMFLVSTADTVEREP
jgi:hypothetical protein